ncbi:MAG: glycosyltransferase family 2 protein [Eubacterium sp.]
MTKPLISVIVPVYNTEKYLDRCVESIVNQTYNNLEIILVDDGSPDNSPAMCNAWAEKDSRIKVIHKENGGAASSRNAGLDIATGDYIGFVDGDDYAELNMYEILSDILEKNKADIAVCGYHINNEENVDSNIHTVSQLDSLKKICVGDYKYGVLWNKLFKRELVIDVRMPNFKCCEDLVFNYYSFKNAENIAECDSKLYHYMQNESSTVHGNFAIGAFDAVRSKEIMLKEEQNTELEKYAVRGLISSSFVVLSGCIQNDAFPNEAEKLVNQILMHKKEILSSNLYTKQDKIKTLVLSLSPKIYYRIIRGKHR